MTGSQAHMHTQSPAFTSHDPTINTRALLVPKSTINYSTCTEIPARDWRFKLTHTSFLGPLKFTAMAQCTITWKSQQYNSQWACVHLNSSNKYQAHSMDTHYSSWPKPSMHGHRISSKIINMQCHLRLPRPHPTFYTRVRDMLTFTSSANLGQQQSWTAMTTTVPSKT